MSRPKRLKLGLHTYPVKYIPGPIEEDDDITLCGQIRYHQNERKIIVCTVATEDVGETVLHEVIHAIVNDRALDKLTSGDGATEMLVASLSRGLTDAFRCNKGLLEYVLKSENGKD